MGFNVDLVLRDSDGEREIIFDSKKLYSRSELKSFLKDRFESDVVYVLDTAMVQEFLSYVAQDFPKLDDLRDYERAVFGIEFLASHMGYLVELEISY